MEETMANLDFTEMNQMSAEELPPYQEELTRMYFSNKPLEIAGFQQKKQTDNPASFVLIL